jgi:hypothetical protein
MEKGKILYSNISHILFGLVRVMEYVEMTDLIKFKSLSMQLASDFYPII